MKILLNDQESEEYLAYLEAKKQPVMLSEFLPFDKLPDFAAHPELLPEGCKLVIPPMTAYQRTNVAMMYDAGSGLKAISDALGLPIPQVRGAIGAYCKKKADLRKLKEAKMFLTEARQSPVAEGSKHGIVIHEELPDDALEAFLDDPPRMPGKVTDEITESLRSMVDAGCSVVFMMAKLNEEFGTYFTKDDITKMRSEL